MYSILRIGGIYNQLQKLYEVLNELCPELNSEINKEKVLIVDLSSSENAEHWAEVAISLEAVSSAIEKSAAGDIGLGVDTAFYRKPLPDGGVAIDSVSVSQVALEAMAKIGADFEATIYPVSEEDNA